jgi:hypothetical protein
MDGEARQLTSNLGVRKRISAEQGQFPVEQLSGSLDILAQGPTLKCISTEGDNRVELEGIRGGGYLVYLDVQVLINLHNPSENEYPLHEIGELPHIPNALEQAWFFGSLGSLHLLAASLSRRHHTERGLAPRQ